MKKLTDNELTKEEIGKLDLFYSENIDEFISLDINEIVLLLDLFDDESSCLYTLVALENYINEVGMDAKIIFEEDRLQEYEKLIKISEEYKINCDYLLIALGGYYYTKDKEKSKHYYSRVFIPGFDLGRYDYFYHLENYISLLDDKRSDLLEKLIKNSEVNPKEYELDILNTYLLLIVNLESKDEKYLYYIDEALKIAYIIVRHYQSTTSRNVFSDSDCERDLCELLTLKFEYFVEKKDYIQAYSLYQELTREIGLSDCTRYYHARDMYYKKMLSYLSIDYPEVKFFENIGYKEFELLTPCDNINELINKNIVLKDKNNKTFEFVLLSYSKDYDDIVIAPILPVIGIGGKMFMKLKIEDKKIKFINRISH